MAITGTLSRFCPEVDSKLKREKEACGLLFMNVEPLVGFLYEFSFLRFFHSLSAIQGQPDQPRAEEEDGGGFGDWGG